MSDHNPEVWEQQGPFLLHETGAAYREFDHDVTTGDTFMSALTQKASESHRSAADEALEESAWLASTTATQTANGVQPAFSGKPSRLTADEITLMLGRMPPTAALTWLLASPQSWQATAAALLCEPGARRSISIHGTPMAFPSYVRLLSRLCREAAEQAEAEVRDETAGSAGTEAAPRPTPALSYLPQAVGEAEAPRTSVSYILWIQQALNRADNAKLIEDGKTGPATRAAVAHFQRLHGLHVDGTVGPDTEKALAAASNMQLPTSGAVQSSPATSHAVYANWSDADDRRKGRNPRDQVIGGQASTTGVVSDIFGPGHPPSIPAERYTVLGNFKIEGEARALNTVTF